MKHYRYLVEAVDLFPKDAPHYTEKVKQGINPDEDWRLIFSFTNPIDAEECAKDEADSFSFRKYRVRDSESDDILFQIGDRESE